MQTAIQQILATLHNLGAQIHLKLPASPRSVHQQRLHLQQIQRQLETLQDEVMERSQACVIPSAYLGYLTLSQLIQTLIQEATNLQHLAEEYPIDPEGSTACLLEMPQRSTNLLTRLHPTHETHKQFLANFLKKSSPLHKTQPVLARKE